MKDIQKSEERKVPIVPAVEQASRVLICLAGSGSAKMSLTEICNAVGIHKSKGYSILTTLGKFGFVERDERDKRYSLGPGLVSLSRRFLDNVDVKNSVEPFLRNLADKTHCTTLYCLISDWHVFVVAKHEGDKNIGITIRVGHRFSITHGAHGKAIAAFLPEEERERLLGGKKLYFHGDPKDYNRKRLTYEMEQCRRKGFSYDIGELNPGINAVASPVFGSGGRPVGCLVVIGVFPEGEIDRFGAAVAEEAKNVSRMMGADIEGVGKEMDGVKRR